MLERALANEAGHQRARWFLGVAQRQRGAAAQAAGQAKEQAQQVAGQARPYLGVSTREIDKDVAQALKVERGVLVLGVATASAAARARARASVLKRPSATLLASAPSATASPPARSTAARTPRRRVAGSRPSSARWMSSSTTPAPDASHES